jgi:hypothetical protein
LNKIRKWGKDGGKKIKRKDILRSLPLFRIKRRRDHPFDSAIIAHLKMLL